MRLLALAELTQHGQAEQQGQQALEQGQARGNDDLMAKLGGALIHRAGRQLRRGVAQLLNILLQGQQALAQQLRIQGCTAAHEGRQRRIGVRDELAQCRQGFPVDRLIAHQALGRAGLNGADAADEDVVTQLQRFDTDRGIRRIIAAPPLGIEAEGMQAVVEALELRTQLGEGPQRIVVAAAHDLAQAAVLVHQDRADGDIQQDQAGYQQPEQTKAAHGYLICSARNCQAERL